MPASIKVPSVSSPSSSSTPALSLAELRRALAIRDLTDPEQGPHALQLLVDAVVASLRDTWSTGELAPLWWTSRKGLLSWEFRQCNKERDDQNHSRRTPFVA
jgi:hypothetical protein